MKKIIILIIIVLTFQLASGQDLESLKYDWQDKPESVSVEVDTSQHSIITLLKKIQQFVYEDQKLLA